MWKKGDGGGTPGNKCGETGEGEGMEEDMDRILKERKTFSPIWERKYEGKKEKKKQGKGLIMTLLLGQVNC